MKIKQIPVEKVEIKEDGKYNVRVDSSYDIFSILAEIVVKLNILIKEHDEENTL